MKSLTVTQAAKKFSACVKVVYLQRESFEVVKDGIPYARLVPVNGSRSNSHEVAADFAKAELGPADRRALASAVRKGRKYLKRVKNPWG